MFKKAIVSILLLLLTYAIQAQYIVQGKMQDSTTQTNISKAAVAIVRISDSVLVGYTRTKADGAYKIDVKQPGNYYILITHPKFADYREDINVTTDKPTINIPTIQMLSRRSVLTAFVVRQRGAIKMRGDTTVYLADSFKVDDNASVEDLLRMLPGIQVDKDGKIQAQGEQVQKVLVDGEEFFGEDPTIATRNLQAKILDKVEVFDDKSEQAKFTGFDDGSREKTINLKMKDNLNKGVFGKVTGGTNIGDYWDNSAMANVFKGKQKLSGYAIHSSTGTTGLGWDDRGNFGGGMGGMSVMDGSGGEVYMFGGSGDDDMGWNGNYNGSGYPKALNAGINYSNKWQDNKYNLNGTIGARNMEVNMYDTSRTTSLLGNTTLVNENTTRSTSKKTKYNGNANYDWTIDTTLSVSLDIGASQSNADLIKTTIGSNTNNGSLLSQSNRTNSKISADLNTNGRLTIKKKLHKVGRTISANLYANNTNTTNDGSLQGYQNIKGTNINLDQKKIKESNKLNTNANIAYTDVLIQEKLQMQVNYNFSVNNNYSKSTTTIKSTPADDYTQRVDSLSNEFSSQVLGHIAGVSFNYNLKKVRFSLGSKISFTQFMQKDVFKNNPYNYNRINYLPDFNMSYNFNKGTRLSFNYDGRTRQPEIYQLQNLFNNEDPLNINLGNPNLKQSFSNNFRVNFNSYKTFTERSLWCGINYNNTIQEILNTQTFNPATGINIYSFDNVNGRYYLSAYLGYDKRIRQSKFFFDVNSNARISATPTIINDVKTIGRSNSFGVEPALIIKGAKKYFFKFSSDFDFSSFRNSFNNTTNNYWTITPNFEAKYFVTKRIIVNTDIMHTWIQANETFAKDFNRTTWNAEILYKMLKSKNLEVGIAATDILNQNLSYNRNTYGNTLSESSNATIRRVVLFKATYFFSAGPMNKLSNMIKDEDDDF